MVDKKIILSNVDATMRMEGMPLTKKDKDRIKKCLDGKASFDQSVEILVKKHSK
jgi:hypothetical protein